MEGQYSRGTLRRTEGRDLGGVGVVPAVGTGVAPVDMGSYLWWLQGRTYGCKGHTCDGYKVVPMGVEVTPVGTGVVPTAGTRVTPVPGDRHGLVRREPGSRQWGEP